MKCELDKVGIHLTHAFISQTIYINDHYRVKRFHSPNSCLITKFWSRAWLPVSPLTVKLPLSYMVNKNSSERTNSKEYFISILLSQLFSKNLYSIGSNLVHKIPNLFAINNKFCANAQDKQNKINTIQ